MSPNVNNGQIVGISGNGDVNGSGMGDDNQNELIGIRIESLQQQSREKIGKVVENESYIKDNPSMGSH